MTQQEEWSNILYGDVLSIFGVKNTDRYLAKYGNKIFDKRTKLHKEVTAARREELKQEFVTKYIPF